ncbi:MAG: sulfatase-like hydrolase/transferase [Bacteroidetes bacterium]|nr:sulfatase-like hydrolase/transferase [Bacteroidota bacterium]
MKIYFGKKLPLLLLRHFIFWMFLFELMRMIFLLWNKEELAGIPFSKFITVFYHGFYVDTAMASYFIIPAFLFLSTSMFLQKEWPLKVNQYFSIAIIVICFIISFSELPIYDEWHTKLNYKAIWFMRDPKEVFHTASWTQLLLGIFTITLFTWLLWRMFKRVTHHKTIPDRSPWWSAPVYFLVSAFLIFYGIRGGFQQIPVQVSDAYFTNNNFLNLTSVNSAFNLFSSCIENAHAGEPYKFMNDAEMKKNFSEMNAVEKDTTIHVLTMERPNVVMVVLEGWSADAIKDCGGYDSITPYFHEMENDGILFTNLYASGSLSDQGMAAIFSAFPSQPKTSIITQPTKYNHLPCINKEFEKAGYHTSYMFGGQLSYGNIRAYMYFNDFENILEDKDFDPSLPRCRLGVADQYLFSRQIQELQNEPQPFFAGMFTLSTHAPFDFPGDEKLHWGGKEKGYINSILYSDDCIKNFIATAKKYPWYKNTLFIFVSDHSHNSPKNWAFNQPEYRHMPLLFFGDVIKPEFRGMKYDSVASQTDLASTLLHQLNMNADAFHYSKNLFNPYTPHYAYYAFDEGFGLVKQNEFLVWDVNGRTEYEHYLSAADHDVMLKQGKTFLQFLTEEYFNF